MTELNVNAGTAGAAVRMPAYPLSILIGCAALDEVDAFDTLPDGFWRVVTRLVKKISVATPFQPIFARRETLARESGKSVETVGRALRWLEDRELIRREQKSRRGLRGSDAHIHPTARLIDALGIGQQRRGTVPLPQSFPSTQPLHVSAVGVDLPAPPEAAPCSMAANDRADPVVDLSTAPAVKIDGSISALQVHSLLKKRQSDETRASTSAKPQPAVQRQTVVIAGKIIPAELGWIAKERGVPATGILRLMGLARKAGQRLSDIVALCRDALAALRGKALYAYLHKLIATDKDYTGLLRKATDEAAKAQQRRQDTELVGRKILEWQGQRYISRDQQRIWLVESNGHVLLESGGPRGSRRMDRQFVDAVMNGDLRRLVA